MSFYLSTVLAHFLLPSVLFAVLYSHIADQQFKVRFYTALFAIIVGAVSYAMLPYSQVYVLSINIALAIVLVVLLFCYLFFPQLKRVLTLWLFLQVALASFVWAKDAKLSMISVTSVINTDLILNLSAILFGFILVAIVHVISTKMLSYRSWWFRRGMLVVLVILALLPISGEILLAAMKLEMVGLYRQLLSYVAKVTNFYWIYAYFVIAACFMTLCGLYIKQMRPLTLQVREQKELITRRLLLSKWRRQRNLAGFYVAALLAVLASLTYWDAIASQPPTRSAALTVKLQGDQAVHIPITNELKDGKLHRYRWIASDGKVVRFFIIDRYANQRKFAVVFDACMLCGDAGYIQSGDQVICLACGVHIFIPSIGHGGGCNPIPIKKWTLSEHEITVSKKMLESGLQYFSDVVKIVVNDPVNGHSLTNLDAPFSYQFGGKTYFFTGKQSYQAFRDDPWKYVQASSAMGGA